MSRSVSPLVARACSAGAAAGSAAARNATADDAMPRGTSQEGHCEHQLDGRRFRRNATTRGRCRGYKLIRRSSHHEPIPRVGMSGHAEGKSCSVVRSSGCSQPPPCLASQSQQRGVGTCRGSVMGGGGGVEMPAPSPPPQRRGSAGRTGSGSRRRHAVSNSPTVWRPRWW
jgi:hypothetical protein